MKAFSTNLIVIALILLGSLSGYSQEMTQNVRGKVYDIDSHLPLTGATVAITDVNPILGNITDADGWFTIEKVPVGRHKIAVSFIGYKSEMMADVLVTSGKEVIINMGLKEAATNMEEVKVLGRKDKPLNSMAFLSARSFNLEETKRYAGSLDDPGRLAASYAGVSTAGLESNAIMVRGNSPNGVLWKVEGVDVPVASHFEGGDIMGGGFVTLFSNQLMAKSDFFTGAFPSEYGNALAGVFDVKFRNGNNQKREHTLQAGVLGIDVASEGPLKKGGKASYLFNYRYSTFGLLKDLLPEDEGVPTYQDLSFKVNMPTKKTGTFSLWGLGGIDHFEKIAKEDKEDWTEEDMRQDILDKTNVMTVGLGHRIFLNPNTFLKSTIAYSTYNHEQDVSWRQDDLSLIRTDDSQSSRNRIAFNATLNHKFSARHTNRTGITFNHMMYDMDLKTAAKPGDPLFPISNTDGNAQLCQLFTQSKFDFNEKLSLVAGIHSQYFALNEKATFEPRASLRYQATPNHAISASFGNHTQTLPLQVYNIERKNTLGNSFRPNKALDFHKANHYVLGYHWRINNDWRLSLEGYYQDLYDLAVAPDSSFAFVNTAKLEGFNEVMKSTGTGNNIGLDLTLERFFKNNYYLLFTSSVYNSKYKGGDGVERNTRYNKNFVVNVLSGKEWNIGKRKNSWLGVNGRLYFLGGERTSPILHEASEAAQEVIYNNNRLYEEQHDANYRVDLGLTLRRNHPKYTGTWSLTILNAAASKISSEYGYNYVTGKVEEAAYRDPLPTISYRIQF